MTKEFYEINIAGLVRNLPLFEVAPGVKIALFDIMGDTEIVVESARALAEKLPEGIEIFVTPEVKSIPLAFELSRITGIPYVVARKIRKPYMKNPIKSEVLSITTGKRQILWLDEDGQKLLKNKKVALLDDVISTGSTLQGLKDLMVEVNAMVVAEVAILTEGDEEKWKEVISLGHLPIFSD